MIPTPPALPTPTPTQRAIKSMLAATYRRMARGQAEGVLPADQPRLACLIVEIAHEAFRAGMAAQADSETERLLGPYAHDWSGTAEDEARHAAGKVVQFPIQARN